MLRMNDQISTLPKEEKPSASRQERGCYTVDDLAANSWRMATRPFIR